MIHTCINMETLYFRIVTLPSYSIFSFVSSPLLSSLRVLPFSLFFSTSVSSISPIADISARADDAMRFIEQEQKQSCRQTHTQTRDTSYTSSQSSSASHLSPSFSLSHSHTLSIAVVDVEGAINRKVSFLKIVYQFDILLMELPGTRNNSIIRNSFVNDHYYRF